MKTLNFVNFQEFRECLQLCCRRKKNKESFIGLFFFLTQDFSSFDLSHLFRSFDRHRNPRKWLVKGVNYRRCPDRERDDVSEWRHCDADSSVTQSDTKAFWKETNLW